MPYKTQALTRCWYAGVCGGIAPDTLYLTTKFTTVMDFLDPQKERRNRIALFTGYVLIGLAIAIASVMLLYQTDGYCIDKKGAVDRCGLVFMSSTPSGATVYVDGKPAKNQTDTKINLRSGSYDVRLTLDGYRDWRRSISVAGGDVERFDYPFLFPKTLRTTTVADFATAPSFASQSPDRRWIVMPQADKDGSFRVYDIKNPAKYTAKTVDLPANIYTASEGAYSWAATEWSDDNRHAVLVHSYTLKGVVSQEYVLLDRQDASASLNLTRSLSLAATQQLTLFDKRPTAYYVYDTAAKTLKTMSIEGDAPSAISLSQVLAYKTYGADTVLYVTDVPPSGSVVSGTVNAVLQQANRSQVVRVLPQGASTYLLDIARYANNWFVVVGSSSDNGVRIYKNLFDQVLRSSADVPSPIRFLRTASPTSVSFSDNAQFIMVSNGQQIGVYDNENDDAYTYDMQGQLDVPQVRPVWMDGFRLSYVSNGRAIVFDYDNQNRQTLQAASPQYPLFFSGNYRYVFSLAPSQDAGQQLTSTSLRVQ